MRNPSYAHGNRWIDSIPLVGDGVDQDRDGADGVGWDPAEGRGLFTVGETFEDLDGDGAFTAWSGRLRGGTGYREIRFRLSIDSQDGKIPLNGGQVSPADGLDNDGDGDIDEPGEIPDRNGNGVPDWRDVGDSGNLAVARALCSLGSVRGIPFRRWDVPAGMDADGDGVPDGERFATSWIGIDLIAERPADGYRSWSEVASTLAWLGYAPEDADRIRPFIRLDPPDPPIGSMRAAHLPLSTVSGEAMQAIWRYVQSGAPAQSSSMGLGASPTALYPSSFRIANDVFGQDAGWRTRCPRSLWSFGPPAVYTWEPEQPALLTLWPEEARELGGAVSLFRAEGGATWRGLRGFLHARCAMIFRRDFDAADAGDPAFALAWTHAKAELAYQAVALDPYGATGARDPLRTWATGGNLVDYGVAGEEAIPVVGFPLYTVAYPASYDPSGSAPSFSTSTFPSPGPVSFVPIGLTTAPSTLFSVDCTAAAGDKGGLALRSGAFQAGRRLEVGDPTDVTTWLGSPGDAPLPPLGGELADACGYPGAVGLEPAELGLGKARLYWSFTGAPPTAADPFTTPPVTGWDSVFDPLWAPADLAWLPPPYRIRKSSSEGLGLWMSPIRPYLSSADGAFANAAMTKPKFLIPGFDPISIGGKPQTLKEASFEAWMGPSSRFALQYGFNTNYDHLALWTRRDRDADTKEIGTVFTLSIVWGRIFLDPFLQKLEWFVPDGPEPVWSYHAFLSLRRTHAGTPDDPYRTEAALTVNGSPFPPVEMSNPAALWERSDLRCTSGGLKLDGVDEIRLYDKALPSPPTPDRFKRKGSFLSPRIDLGRATALGTVQWHGLVPSGYGSPISVSVTGYDEDGSAVKTVGLPGGPGDVLDLAALGMPKGIRALRYGVQIDLTGLDASGKKAFESPVFESIWIAYRQVGASPWLSYR